MDVILTASERKDAARKRRRISANKCWITDEEVAIANYLVDKPYLGKDKAKETLSQYQKRMLRELKLADCDAKRLKNKVMHMKKKYEKVHKWISEVKPEIEKEDPNAFSDVVKNLCHYYYILDKRLDSNHGCNNFQRKQDRNITISSNSPQSCLELDDSVRCNEETLESSRSSVNSFSDAGNSSEDSILMFDSPPIEIERFKNKFARTDRLNFKTSPMEKLAKIFKSKYESRFEIEKQKLEWQKYTFMELEKSKIKEREEVREMEMKKLQMQRELELEKLRLNNEIEIRKIALEEKRLKLEYLKLKSEHSEWPDDL